ncbi:MAG: hypothetical protein ACC707_09245 [Thiohalomonadales bacterium]
MQNNKILMSVNIGVFTLVILSLALTYRLNNQYKTLLNSQLSQPIKITTLNNSEEVNDLNVLGGTGNISHKIDEIHARLMQIDAKQVSFENSISDILTDADTQDAPALVTAKLDVTQATQLFNQISESGYLYSKDWDALDEQTRKLDKVQNKAFWQKMFSALEQGKLELFDE